MIIAPIKNTKQASKKGWVKQTEETKKIKKTWEDGYQLGDVTKTIISGAKIAKDTAKDVGVNIGKGFLRTTEGMVDSARYLGYDAFSELSKSKNTSLLGGSIAITPTRAKTIANTMKKNAQMDVTGALLGETNDIFKENWSKKIDEKSVFDTKADSVSQGIGNVAAFVGVSNIAPLLKIGQTGAASQFLNSFTSAYGNTRSEAYINGADDKTARTAATISGFSEAISEQFFSGIPGMKTAGWGDKLVGKIGSATNKYFNSTTGKMVMKALDASGEGFEEILSNILNATGNDIAHYFNNDYNYGMENQSGNIFKDILNEATSQESWDAFISALLTSAITTGGTELINNNLNKSIIKSYAKENEISVKEATELFNKIAERRTELQETDNYKEYIDAIDQSKNALRNKLKQDLKSDKKINLEELLNSIPKNKSEMQFTFNNDEIKNVKSEKQNVLANDMTRLNNVKENHDLYKTVNAIQSANETQQYHITTTEGLYEMGLVDKTADGKYVMKDGSPYVPRGLNYKDGDIYINADVGAQSGTQAVYHEMLEGFKKASPEAYDNFKQMVKDIVGEQAIQESINEYSEMYGENLTDNIEDEIINDKFGELAENENFINKISDNRTVLEKFIDSIKNMIKYVKGTSEEKQLMKLQKNLESEFAKRYKETDFSNNSSSEEIRFSVKENYKNIENNVERALSDKNSKGLLTFDKPKLGETTIIKAYYGIDTEGWNKTLSDDDIRHMLKEHGDSNKEMKKGQIAITKEDIINIPDIIKNYDSIEKGNKNGKYNTIRYVRNYNDNVTYLVEVILDDQKLLQIKTMWKKPTTKTNVQQNPSLTAKPDSSMTTTSSANNISQNDQKVNDIAPTKYSMQKDDKYSLTSNKNIDSKEIAPIDSTIQKNIAPFREDIKNLSDEVKKLSKQLETTQNKAEMSSSEQLAPMKQEGYVETYKEGRYENEKYTPLTEKEANLYQESLKNDENYIKSLEESADFEKNNEKLINKLSNEVQNKLKITNKEKSTLNNVITDALENKLTADEILDKLNSEFVLNKVKLNDDALFEDAADYIHEGIINDMYNDQMNSYASLDKDIQFNFAEDVLPTTIRSQESIDNFINDRDIAPVKETKQNKINKSEIKEQASNMKDKFQQMFVNRNQQIDKLAKVTGNEDIKYAGDMLNSVSGEAQYNINNKQTNMDGITTGKSVKEIFAPAKQTGLYEVLNDYLIQKSNIERHAVGKGSQVPLVVSQQLVEYYETQYPQVKTWANDVYKYFDNVLQDQVDSGLITKEQYNNYRGENGIYRSYVPFYSDNNDSKRYFDDEGNLRAISTLKKSKGGQNDTSLILSVEDSMIKQTYAYKKAIRTNELYKQIVSTMEKFDGMVEGDIRSNPTNLEDSLYTDVEGNKVLSAYINGEKVSSIISDDLFNELSRTNENRIKQFEQDFSLLTNPLQKVSNVRRNLLTTWNPAFLARNAIKDIQDAVINSKHTTEMLKNYFGNGNPKNAAIMELSRANTQEAQQFLALYGADNLYGDYSNITETNNVVKKGINKFSKLNELIELAPRFAEFKASLQNGESVQQAIYNAREVTTNFGRGGYITKALNRNGFTFLNANVQGLDKVIRNITGQNGVKGVTSVVIKGAAFSILPSILNHMLFGIGDDKDEEYEALPDYIKDNYYLIKLTNNKFIRIPKGRITAAIGSAARRSIGTLEGENNAFEGWAKNAWDQIGVGDLGGNNILAPIKQAVSNKAWYGGDIVPTRLQKLPSAEQSDEKTDAVSKFIGEKLNISPKKINYVLDQYSGGIGDMLLPMITPATSDGSSNAADYLTAPIRDAFVVNSTDDNKYAGEFYDTKDKLEIKSNSANATDEDKLRYKYISSVSSELSKLYAERREVQADTSLSNKKKYEKVQVIQNEINSLAKEALKNYNDFSLTDNYTQIGENEYYKDEEGKWNKVSESDSEFTAGMTKLEKSSYYKLKDKISGIKSNYNNLSKETKDEQLKKTYSNDKKAEITQAIINSGLDDYSKAMIYGKNYSSEKAMTNVYNAGYNIDTYITALYDIDELRNKYSQTNGYTTEQRKAKTIAYINSLNMEIPQKAMLLRQYYSSFKEYNKDIVNFVSNLDITYEEKVSILEGTGMKINGNRVEW